jgi:hypothetical protein
MTRKRSPHLKFGLLIALFAFLLDQFSKWVIITPLSLELKRVVTILPIFDLRWAENCGISLSMFASCTETTRWTLVAVTALVALAVAFWMTVEKAKGDVVALAMIFGGARLRRPAFRRVPPLHDLQRRRCVHHHRRAFAGCARDPLARKGARGGRVDRQARHRVNGAHQEFFK